MEIIYKNIDDLKAYENNPRQNQEAIKAVAASIKQFGFKVPCVVDLNNIIVCGHTRVLAAKDLKLDKVPCIIVDDLNEEQIKAFRLADNKVSELSLWDFEKLDNELSNIINLDMSQFGFINLDLSNVPPDAPTSSSGSSKAFKLTLTFEDEKEQEKITDFINLNGKDEIKKIILRGINGE